MVTFGRKGEKGRGEEGKRGRGEEEKKKKEWLPDC